MLSRWSALACVSILTACSQIQKAPEYRGQGQASVDATLAQRFAPPTLPPRIEAYVRSLFEVTEPGLGILSPNGKTLYFTWTVSGTRQVWKTEGPLQFPEQVTSGADSTSIFDVTYPDGKYLVLTRDRSGEENPGIYLQPTAGGPLIEVQHKRGVRTFPIWMTNDGETLFYMANDIKPDSYAIYSYGVVTGKRELLFSEPGLWFVADVQGGSRFLLGKRTGARTREFYEWSSVTRELKPVIGQNEREEYSALFGRSSDSYFVLTTKGGDFRRLYSYAGGKLQPITPDEKADVESFMIDPRHTILYLQWNRGGLSQLEALDAATLKRLPLPKIAGAEQTLAGWTSRFGRYVTLSGQTSLAPSSNFVYDWSTRQLTRWTRPSLPEIDASRFRKPALEFFPARDGTKIPMWVTRPADCAKSETPCPVVVSFHGGPESQSRPGFNRAAQLFAGAGFIYAEPNVRGSDGYGKSYREADDGVKRLQVITDIEDCAKHFRASETRGGIAPRVGVMGGSYGGYSALMAMSRFAGSYDAGVSIVGMSDLRTFLKNTAPYRTILRTSEYGDPERDARALEELSPITYVGQVRDPLLIIQGVNDPRVPVGEAVQMHEALRRRSVDAPLILFADEGHQFGKRDNRVLQYGHALQFFIERLAGHTTARPVARLAAPPAR